MPRKRLTAQDAFIGVREEELEAETPNPETAPEPPPPAPEGPEPKVGETLAAAPRRARGTAKASRDLSNLSDEELDEGPFEFPKTVRLTGDGSEERYLESALREAQNDLDARLAVERVTVYLTEDISGELERLWEEVRGKAGLKISKSSLILAAVRIVLNEPSLRAHAAAFALREKARRSPQR